MGTVGAGKGSARKSRRRGSRVTVSDVARRAGLSPMTVSRVINRAPNVLDETRERVEAAVIELGYVPNTAARSLAGRGPCQIALIHSNPSAAYLSEVLVGALAGVALVHGHLLVEHWDGDEAIRSLADRLVSRRVDAVILPPPLCDDAGLLDALAAGAIPVALIASGAPAAHSVSVSISDENAAHAMTSYLIGLGHCRIGFVRGCANQTASALRERGHRHALEDAGVEIDASLIVDGDFTYRSGLAAAEALLDRTCPPTAIFASNDDMAAAVVAVAHRRHIDVPGQLSVCGFDDTFMAQAIWPELTTIRQPVADMARQAVVRLIAHMTGNAASPSASISVPFDLIARASSARLQS